MLLVCNKLGVVNSIYCYYLGFFSEGFFSSLLSNVSTT